LSDQAQAVLSLSPTVLVAGVCTVIMVVALVAYMVYGGRRTSSTTTAPVIPSQTQIAQPAQETPKSENRLIQSGDSGPAVTPLAQDVAGKVYDGTEVQWNKDLYYIVIAATPRMDVTRKNADFLAQHGVSVVISKTNRGMFALISYQGFSTNKDAEVLRKRIVDLGKIHPDAKKTAGKGVWYDAYVWQFRPKG
jgi:hypothetical protein